LNEHEVLILMC